MFSGLDLLHSADLACATPHNGRSGSRLSADDLSAVDGDLSVRGVVDLILDSPAERRCMPA